MPSRAITITIMRTAFTAAFAATPRCMTPVSYTHLYCGQGVPLATYYGKRIGQQMLGLPEGRTALDGVKFASRPYYFGVPWFLAPSVLAFRLMDAAGW